MPSNVTSVRGETDRRCGQAGQLGQEEDAHCFLSESGVPAGVHLRHEAVPEQLGAGLLSLQPAADGDSGQDVVSEQEEQMETTAISGTGGGQHGPRLRTDTSGDAAGFQR